MGRRSDRSRVLTYLERQVPDRNDDGDSADNLSDCPDGFPVHVDTSRFAVKVRPISARDMGVSSSLIADADLIFEDPVPLAKQLPEPSAEDALPVAKVMLDSGMPKISLVGVEEVLPCVGIDESVLAKTHEVLESESSVLHQGETPHPLVVVQLCAVAEARSHYAGKLGVLGNLDVDHPTLFQRLMIGRISYCNGVFPHLASVLTDLYREIDQRDDDANRRHELPDVPEVF
jgi:hypothetical protein